MISIYFKIKLNLGEACPLLACKTATLVYTQNQCKTLVRDALTA